MLRSLLNVVLPIVGGALGAGGVLWFTAEPDLSGTTVDVAPSITPQAQTGPPPLEQVTPPATLGPERVLYGLQDASTEREALSAQLLALELRFNRLAAEVEKLAEGNSNTTAPAMSASSPVAEEDDAGQPLNDMQRYMDVGLDPVQVDEIARRQADLEMRSLYLREQAAREGWIGGERYAEAQRELDSIRQAVREEVGEDAYDRYLYASGQPNRIRVSSIIRGSPAEQAGLLADDVIVSYDGRSIMTYDDLTRAIRDGNPGESVSVAIVRDEYNMAVSMPRGPLGVRLAALRLEPR